MYLAEAVAWRCSPKKCSEVFGKIHKKTLVHDRPSARHERARCEQIGELNNYTFLESSDHVDNGKKLFFITFGATSFLRHFSKESKRHIADVVH